MGCCVCKEETLSPLPPLPPLPSPNNPEKCTIQYALKFPHGSSGVSLASQFVHCDINEWLNDRYRNATWTGWMLYNDETPSGETGRKGHCKGILAWNDTHLSWLIHSVPRFPRTFTGSSLSEIEPSELLYGQSFAYLTRPTDLSFLRNVIAQIYHMDAQIYEIRNEVIVPQICHKGISYLAFSDTIAHIAKSSEHHIDIYSEFLTKYADHWYVETWKRGHAILESPSIKDVTSVSILGTTYKESQDHAKWAVAAQYFWMGDLNRMITQAKRGGGGLLDMHKGTIEAFRAIIHA